LAPWLQPREGFLIDIEILSSSNRHDFNQDLLVDDPVHDTDGFLGGVEFVIAGEVEACSVSEMLAESRGSFEFSELLGNRVLQRAVENLPPLQRSEQHDIARRCSFSNASSVMGFFPFLRARCVTRR
jgi:hypothetical protein